jgi:hypothetical protein
MAAANFLSISSTLGNSSGNFKAAAVEEERIFYLLLLLTPNLLAYVILRKLFRLGILVEIRCS